MNKIFIIHNTTDQYAILKKLVSEKYGMDKNSLYISFNSHGKPFFANYPHIHFNISHSSCLTVIAVGEKAVGIDVEKLRHVDFRIAKRFTEEEYHYINESDSHAFLKYGPQKKLI